MILFFPHQKKSWKRFERKNKITEKLSTPSRIDKTETKTETGTGKTKITGKMSIPPTIKILHKNSCLHGISQHFSAIKCWISCLKQSRLWFSEWLDPNYLKYWPFGILTENAILRIPLKLKKKTTGTRIFLFFCVSLDTQGEWIRALVLVIQRFTAHSGSERVFLIWEPLSLLFIVKEKQTRYAVHNIQMSMIMSQGGGGFRLKRNDRIVRTV